MLNRLSIGLMSEGAQLTRIVPDSTADHGIDEGERGVAFARKVETAMKVLPWLRQSRMTRLVEAFEKSTPDVLYAVGQQSWPVATELANALDRPLIIDIHSILEARTAPRPSIAGSQHIAGYIAPCTSLASELQQRFDPSLIHLVPMGVAIPALPRSVLNVTHTEPTVAIVGDCRDVRSYSILFDGLAHLAGNVAGLQLFLELRGPHDHEVWRHAQSPNLIGRVSAIGDAALYRSLITQCDIMLIPESDSRVRSVILEAMALGLPIIAKPDPVLDMLIDGETALLVDPCDSRRWDKLITSLFEDPAHARDLGACARACVTQTYRSSDQVNKLMTVLTNVAFGGNLRINQGAGPTVN